ncbi:MAG: hypothetical protein IT347_06625 [Candidatus Eisenbacteria bacterium]|nr:hypothetical protein [Candidatus Eisenbacteria bacterium]
MHLLAAWTSLGTLDLLRLLGIPAAVLVAALLPGRTIARGAALAVAVAAALLAELPAPAWVRVGWPMLWLLVAWRAGAADEPGAGSRAPTRGSIESGLLALVLGLAIALLLLAGASRQALAPADARLTSLGALLVSFGLLHLMLRRHLRRALAAFAALGLGLELLAAAARSLDALHAGAPAGGALAATLVAMALAHRIAISRERFARSPYVGDAHELHD